MLFKPRHIALLTGGYDTTAMALWLKKNMKLLIEYIFLDTGVILPETFDFLKKLENHIGKIKILKTKNYEEHLKEKKYFFPTPRYRWCTRDLKIKTLMEYTDKSQTFLYLSVKPSEKIKRNDYRKKRIINIYPLQQYNIKNTKAICKTHQLYNEAYELKPRAGCWPCFFTGREQFIKIFTKHPQFLGKFCQWTAQNKLNYKNRQVKKQRTALYNLINKKFIDDLVNYCPQKKDIILKETQRR